MQRPLSHPCGRSEDPSQRRHALRQAARAIDQARARRSRAPDGALEHWQALVSGRWSLADRGGRAAPVGAPCASVLGHYEFVHFRRGEQHGHIWRISDDEFLKACQLVREGFNQFATHSGSRRRWPHGQRTWRDFSVRRRITVRGCRKNVTHSGSRHAGGHVASDGLAPSAVRGARAIDFDDEPSRGREEVGDVAASAPHGVRMLARGAWCLGLS